MKFTKAWSNKMGFNRLFKQNDNLQQDSILWREQVIITRAIDNAKDNLNLIRDEMDEMRKDGDDKTDPEKFKKFKNEKEKASVLLN